MKKTITYDERVEIINLRKDLKDHIEEYKAFKNFIKTSLDGVKICDALLNNDYKTFKTFKLKYTTHTADKMKGLNSLSTYKKTSIVCKTLSACKDFVCSKCYAERSISLYKTTLKPVLIYNTLLLKYIDIDASQIPYINDEYFRFEAFSDLQSIQHFKNLLTVCKKNKSVLFTLWTKSNLKKIIKDLNINKLPSNLNIVISEYAINKITYDMDDLKDYQNRINTKNNIKYFIVYDNEEKRKDNNFYQCKLKCVDCLYCYKKHKEIKVIAEGLR